ncbi:hypothetical protein GH721_15730 [Kriegella sp. EG-1]|nr:hypothetical protein [Flavobacteriaceae bacterium EG-1]
MRKAIFLSFLLVSSFVFAQTKIDSIALNPQSQLNSAQRLLSGNYASTVTVSAYAEIAYNQPESDNATLDIPRMVLLFGYRFNEKAQFVTEVEMEHIRLLVIEQAFVNYNVANNVNLRGGLMLVPMGIINEFHEPTTFNGTDRPSVDRYIVPTTWREIGVGVSGNFNDLSLGYQAYVFNGFKTIEADGLGGISGLLQGSDGLRSGRQSGALSTMDSPTFSAKLDYYGIAGLRLGLSTYFGQTQASDEFEVLEGSNIGVSMFGLDARYAYQRFAARGQFIYNSLSDTDAYNILTGKDLGSALMGYYVEGSYNLLTANKKQKLFVFARFENYDTHADTAGDLEQNPLYDRTDVTTGLSYHIAPGVVLKGDYQFKSNALNGSDVDNQLNFGIGVWF